MTQVSAQLPTGKSISPDDFADITSIPVSGLAWGSDGLLKVTFDGTLSAAEQAAVTDRISSRNTNEETLRQRARTALASNRDYLAIPSPTQAQAVAQVAALTRQMNAVIRISANMLDGTD